MNKKNCVIVFLSTAFLLTSCISGLSNLGINYKGLTAEEKEMTRTYPQTKDEEIDENYIYKVTPQQLTDYLSTQERTILYSYRSDCTSEHCISAKEAEQICKENGFSLTVLTTDYPTAVETKQEEVSPSVMVMVMDNSKYFVKSWVFYEMKYIGELTGLQKEQRASRFLRFNKGKFCGSFQTCKEAVEN